MKENRIPPQNPADFRSSVRVIKQSVEGNKALPPEEDFLAIEDPLEIELVYDEVEENPVRMVTMRTPGQDRAMIYGFLYGERIIQKASDVVDIEFNHPMDPKPPTLAKVFFQPGRPAPAQKQQREFAIHSSCGVCGTTSIGNLALPVNLRLTTDYKIDAGKIHQLPLRMNQLQETFRQTGGLHAAAIFDGDGELIISHEDIGRHNALDKAIGSCLLSSGLPDKPKVLCVSGRMSYEILQKAIVAQIPIVAGVGAPSSLAVTMASDFNVTLIGFVRNNRYNIYSGPERLLTSPSNG
jgi:FdhD protein